MSLYNPKKIEHLEKAKGKYTGSGIKSNNYEYGRNKAKKIAISRAINKKKS